MFISCDKNNSENWKDYTLLIPAVCVGNVGQLAADLVISTLYMSKVGHLYDSSILPVIGNDPFAVGDSTNACQLATAAEVYESAQQKLVTVQLRSALVQGYRQQFLDGLMAWIESCGFRQVLILTSSYSHERRDEQLHGSQFRYVASPKMDASEAGEVLSTKLKFPRLEKRPSHVYDYARRPATEGDVTSSQDMTSEVAQDAEEEAVRQWSSDLYIPGGGYAKNLFQKCMRRGVAVAVFMVFCAEGDNAADALRLVSHLNHWQQWVDLASAAQQASPGHQQGWKIPSSWKLLFGAGYSQSLF